MTKLRDGVPVPPSPISVLPLRSGAVFPGATLTFAVGRPRSVALVRNLYPGDVIATFTQKDPRVVDLAESDLHPFGTFARVKSVNAAVSANTSSPWRASAARSSTPSSPAIRRSRRP